MFGGTELPSAGLVLFNDGYVVDTSGSATALPAPPTDSPLYEPAALARDDVVVVVGIACASQRESESSAVPDCDPGGYRSAVFDAKAGEWADVEMSPELSESRAYYARPVGVVQSFGIFELVGPGRLWAFDFAARSWAPLPSPGFRVDDVCATPDGLVAVTSDYRRNGEIYADDPARDSAGFAEGASDDGYVNARVATLPISATEGAWSAPSAPSSALFSITAPRLSCTTDAVLLTDGDGISSLSVLIDGSWRAGQVPSEVAGGYYPHRVLVGEDLVFVGSESSDPIRVANLTDDGDIAWRELPAPGVVPEAVVATTSGDVVIIPGPDVTGTGVAAPGNRPPMVLSPQERVGEREMSGSGR